MTHRRTKKQHGGMKLSHESLQYLIDNGIEYNDFNVMRFLIANTTKSFFAIIKIVRHNIKNI